MHISILVFIRLRWAALARTRAQQRNAQRPLRPLATTALHGTATVQLVLANVDLGFCVKCQGLIAVARCTPQKKTVLLLQSVVEL